MGRRGVRRDLAVSGRGRRGVTPSIGVPRRRPSLVRGGGALGRVLAGCGRRTPRPRPGLPGRSRAGLTGPPPVPSCPRQGLGRLPDGPLRRASGPARGRPGRARQAGPCPWTPAPKRDVARFAPSQGEDAPRAHRGPMLRCPPHLRGRARGRARGEVFSRVSGTSARPHFEWLRRAGPRRGLVPNGGGAPPPERSPGRQRAVLDVASLELSRSPWGPAWRAPGTRHDKISPRK